MLSMGYKKVSQTDYDSEIQEAEEVVPPAGPSFVQADKKTEKDGSSSGIRDFGDEEHRAIFWSRKQGIYFAYKWR